MGCRPMVCCILVLPLALSSCSLLKFHRKSVPPPGTRAASPNDSAAFLLANGTSPLSPELAQVAGERGLQDAVVDTLFRTSGFARARLRSGERIGTDSLVRVEAMAALLRRWPDLRHGVDVVPAHQQPKPGGPWSCQLRLRYRPADHRAMRGELEHRMRIRLDQLSDAADSAEVLASSAAFEQAILGLSSLSARGVSEWHVPTDDMSSVIAMRLDRLLRRIRIQPGDVRADECLYLVRVRTVDATGRRMAAVPLTVRLPPGVGQVTAPDLPSNDRGEAVFLVQPSVTDSIPITIQIGRQELANQVSVSPAASTALMAALGRYSTRVQAKTTIDLREQGAIPWHVVLVSRWRQRRWLFGSSMELTSLVADVSIDSSSPFSRRAAVHCTRVVIGKMEWVPPRDGLLLASFVVSGTGAQIRRLSTTQLLEGVNNLARKTRESPPPAIRICFALDLDAACAWPVERRERWETLPYSP